MVATYKDWSVTFDGTMIYKMGTPEESVYTPAEIDCEDFLIRTLNEGWMQPEVFLDAYFCSCRTRGITHPRVCATL